MILTINNITAMLVPVIVTFYMLSYTRWLWQQNKKGAAFGAALLAVATLFFPGYVLFFVHR
ncbi:MAG: hypothetical protein WAO24_06515 [Peptococcia bacterium]